jgi:hypothetical protein
MKSFRSILVGGVFVAIAHEGTAPETYPPEKADPAKYHLPGETPPPDSSLITFQLTASTATNSTVSLGSSIRGVTE